jgi:hypothetical protein
MKKPGVQKNYGTLPMPEIVVAGPANIELTVNKAETVFCTFRIVQGPSRTVFPVEKK